MQEIADGVYLETSYSGVILGAIAMDQGLLMVDAPIYPEDSRSWRSSLMNFSSVGNRMLVSMDAHHDRSLGLRNMECRLIGHNSLIEVYQSRPVSVRAQILETGAEWELLAGLSSFRWLAPEITFTESISLNWGVHPVVLEYHPGPAVGATWALATGSGVAFIADAVVADMPPFLHDADIDDWLATLALLSSPAYKNYVLVSGRSGIITKKDIDNQMRFLEKVDSFLKRQQRRKTSLNEIEAMANKLMNGFPESDLYQKRLAYGLSQYFQRHYLAKNGNNDG
jgi:hypothetical protein